MKVFNKAIQQLKAKIKQLIKLASRFKKYIITIVDLEQKLEQLIKASLAPTAKRKVVVFSTETQQVTYVGSFEQYRWWATRICPPQLKSKVRAFWVNVTTSEIIEEIF